MLLYFNLRLHNSTPTQLQLCYDVRYKITMFDTNLQQNYAEDEEPTEEKRKTTFINLYIVLFVLLRASFHPFFIFLKIVSV